VGTFAVQFAKALGADVTAVCSTNSVEMARSIGADHLIDYLREDFAKRSARKQRRRYDLILGINGYHSIFAYRRALRRRGTYVMVGLSPARLFRALFQGLLLGLLLGRVLSMLGRKKMRNFVAKMTPQDYGALNELLEAGKVVPVIDRSFPSPRR